LALPFTILSSPNGVRLVAGEDFRYSLDGAELDAWLPAWLPTLDGQRTLAEALASLVEERRDTAREIVARLYGERVLIDGPAACAHQPAAFSLQVEGEGFLHQELTAACQSACEAGKQRLSVLCQDRLDYEQALRFNRRRREEGVPWLWASCAPMSRAYVSPLFLSDAGPCLECLLNHFQRLSPVVELYAELVEHSRRGRPIVPTPIPGRSVPLLAQLVRWKAELSCDDPAPAALFRLHVLEVASLEISSHRVFPDPECASCTRRI
jgi:bacteriocin biosynthesis cyclodehydratase domain-containing protein